MSIGDNTAVQKLFPHGSLPIAEMVESLIKNHIFPIGLTKTLILKGNFIKQNAKRDYGLIAWIGLSVIAKNGKFIDDRFTHLDEQRIIQAAGVTHVRTSFLSPRDCFSLIGLPGVISPFQLPPITMLPVGLHAGLLILSTQLLKINQAQEKIIPPNLNVILPTNPYKISVMRLNSFISQLTKNLSPMWTLKLVKK
ncbi:hypothetical protein HY086_06575 [Candidatus Gottesmanbacteria bacterium]|nr:hypothetical protein [Candidatus Gottesmanbacteria bacterium]